MKKLLIYVCFLVITGVSNISFAGLVGVSVIEIKSAIPDWLQVSEIVAIQTGTLIDVALASNGASASSSSTWGGGSSPAYAIDGIFPSAFPNIFHSGAVSLGEFLKVTLASPSELDYITLAGRTDCCSNRDIYKLTLFDSAGNLLYTANNLDATGSTHSVTVNLPNTAVPEPTSIMLLVSGLLGFGALRRKKNQA